jgi:hypothetical protein
MAAGTLQMAWINKGDNSEEQYHVMYGVDGQNRTMKARTVHGKAVLTSLLTEELSLQMDHAQRLLDELHNRGTANVAGLNVSDTELRKLDLA